MPMRMYEIRNEYGLGDPELYRAADKDDPEALLEGVAMSGLVGLLRQLGDLAEFAAEIFRDLHEEVMVTAARGHGLMARVQQLEAEFPLIEKAVLSQTNHFPFFTNSGVDWHANLRMEYNLITQGDLPRFVMDSCEECRGPPLLCHLDKFDVAGVGACLKRYTDPSFFKVETASSEIPTVEVQREKKVRKAKKKASSWRNGETPEVVPASHAKLHQLFLEERAENGHPDPARLVKLKRRQLNGSLFDQKSGKSYMEKFLESSSPENKMVCADSVTSPLRLTFDNSSESGLDIHEISVVSPVQKSPQGKETMFSSVNEEQVSLENYADEVNGENFDVAVSDPIGQADTYESSSTVLNIQTEEDFSVDADDKTEGSVDGVHSNDLNSEVENYMDALATMESELETDNESKPNNDKAVSSVGKHGTDSGANQNHMDVQGNFSDSQSIWNSSLSCDGNSLVRERQSSFSSATPSDGEGAAESLHFTENCVAEVVDLPSNNHSMLVEIGETESHDLIAFNDMCIKEEKTPDPVEASCISCPTGSKTEALPLGPVENLPGDHIALGSELPITDRSELNLTDTSVFTSDVQDSLFVVSSERHPVHELDREEDPDVLSDSLMHPPPVVNLDLENKCIDDFVKVVDKVHTDNLIQGNIGTPQSIIASAGEYLTCPASADTGVDLGVTSLPGSLDILQPDDLDFETRGDLSETDAIEARYCTDATVCVSQVELISIEENRAPYSKERINLQETSGSLDAKEMGGFTSKVDDLVRDVAPPKEMGVSIVPSDTNDREEMGGFIGNVDDVIGDAAPPKEMGVSVVPSDPDDREEMGGFTGKVDDVIGDAAPPKEMGVSVVPSDTDDREEMGGFTGKVDDVIGGVAPPKEVGVSIVPSDTDDREEMGGFTGKVDDVIREAAPPKEMGASMVPSDTHDREEMGGFTGKVDDVIRHAAPPKEMGVSMVPSDTDDGEEMSGFTGKVDDVIGDAAPPKEMGVSMVPSDTDDGEEMGGFTGKVDDVIGDAALLEHPCNSLSELGSYGQEASDNEVTKLLREKDAAPSVAAVATPTDATSSAKNVISSSSDLVSSSSNNLLDVQLSLSGSKGLHKEEFVSEATSPECLAEALNEVKPEATLADLDSGSHKSLSGDDYSRLNLNQFAPKSSLIEQTQKSLHGDEETGASSTKLGNWELVSEKISKIKSAETRNDVVDTHTSYLPQAESSAEFSIQAEQITANEIHTIMGGANSESLNVVESEQSFKLQSNQLVGQSLLENGQSSKLLDLQPEQSKALSHIDEARCLDDSVRSSKSDSEDLPSHDLLPEPSGNKLASVPFSSGFPSGGLRHEATLINLEEMPPLPPLPPMQWRMGKVQPAPLTLQREWVDQNQGTCPPMQPWKAPSALTSSDNVIVQSPVPYLYHTVEDVQRPQHVSLESGENSWHPSPPYLEVQTINDAANSQETHYPLEEAQSSKPYLTLPEAPNDRPEHCFHEFDEEEKQSTSDQFLTVPQMPAAEPASSGHDPVPATDLPSSTKAGLEMPEQNSQTLVGEEVTVCDNSVEPLIQVEQHPQDDLVSTQVETTWSPSTLALPLTYGVGKLNGNKLPLPRNPLIDAVAAHDKSKLRKVAERVRPQIVPKLEERDSLLEQIRTKSFNLKPASVTRPSMHGMQGPKTNLKVAAILEKANAIRQALAGSDEDDDSGSWSDS